MLYFLLPAGIVWGLPTIYLAYRFREYRKFLAGAFFVSWGWLLYLHLANVPVPLLGMNLVFAPESSGARSIPHFYRRSVTSQFDPCDIGQPLNRQCVNRCTLCY
jgi:hypothetical protein